MALNINDDTALGREDDWFPIREVARLTGVNPVTLRAWERRYGLIVPRRTPKGHRLYDDSHVKRIQSILKWLNRGVAVGQVKQLLDARQSPNLTEHSQWGGLQNQMSLAVTELSERQLDDSFNRALSLYPPVTLCKHLLLPLLLSLEQRWTGAFGAELERGLFYSWLRTKLGTRIYHSNRQHNGAPLLLTTLCEQRFEPGLWLSAWLVSSAGCPAEVIEWLVPLAELPLAVERIKPRGLLLYASQSLDSGYLKRQLPRLADTQELPMLLVGPAASIHLAELRNVPGLTLAIDPLAALEALQAGPLLEKPKGFLE
ncbi:MerR family transcriptional regulator [Stutzerimonas xanthomarina]|uniref:Transcriptional regulator, MerR family n=2 Tax=Stutzerimonas xanthomarina TaxID=271420 RepID=A0A1M5MLH0_9GAMM|nr:MerR family transcriptional regulator [Stutzerimonas xanthomarina]MCP9337545.1 MerR family transcriptional regulator [Stutzerimonas xanthomarina]SEH88676.1 DNA-binding transcriptional regulator, MerR family [Stutzerimonas xanthomarina]SHG77892.1 transcriptional regulator, MerR family [Stutzerimonas xanthomarina DSM 18231]